MAEGDTETQKRREWLPLLQDLAGDDQEGISPASRSNSGDNQLLSEDSGAQQSGTVTPFFYYNYSDYSLLSPPATCWLKESL